MASSAPGNGDPNERESRPQRIGRLNPDEITVADLLGREIASGKVIEPPSSPGRRLAAGAGVVFVVGSMVAGAAVFGKTVPTNGTGEPPRSQPDSGFPEVPRPGTPALPPRPAEPANPRGGVWAPGPGNLTSVSPLDVLAPPTGSTVLVDLARSTRSATGGSAGGGSVAGAASTTDRVVGGVANGLGELTNGVGGTVEKSADGVGNVLDKADAGGSPRRAGTRSDRARSGGAQAVTGRTPGIEPANLRPATSKRSAARSIGEFGATAKSAPATLLSAADEVAPGSDALGSVTEVVDLGGLL